MDTNIIFDKTELGRRAAFGMGDVTPDEGLVLIFINGSHSVADIVSEISNKMDEAKALACLESMLAKDFIIAKKGGASASPSAAAKPAASTPPPPRNTGGGVDPKMRSIIETEMVEYVGPMAKILCADIWKQTASLNEAITLLKAKLPSDKVDVFVQTINQKIASK